jgi:sugar lactone lactonase YvrE
MNRIFIGLRVAALATILVPMSAHANALAFDAAGNLYAADPSRHSVFKYTADGTKSTFATGLRYPLGLCFDGKGNLFVSDGSAINPKSRRSILKFTSDRKRSTFVTGISSVGMAFDRSGNLFVSEGDSIFKFTLQGVKSTLVISKLANFIDLAFDEAGNLFVEDQSVTVTDAGVGRSIFKFSPDGTKSTFATGLKDPSGLAVDAAGNVYVIEVAAADATSQAIVKFTPGGTKSTGTSMFGRAFRLGIAIDRSGNVFVSSNDSILKFDSSGTPSTFASEWVSPDKQWEYTLWVDGHGPGIVKAGTTQLVLDFPEELDVSGTGEAEVVWAPDSKRFAFNYSPPHAHHTTYETVAFYQLRGDKWVALHSPVDESERAQLVQLAKDHLPKSFNPRHCAPNRDVLKLRKWTDANTAILYAPCYGRMSGQLEAGFLFTLKFDDAGNWKIIKAHQMSKKELEDEQ